MKKYLKITTLIVITVATAFTTITKTIDATTARTNIIKYSFVKVLYRYDDVKEIAKNYPDTSYTFQNPYDVENSEDKFVLQRISGFNVKYDIIAGLFNNPDHYLQNEDFIKKFKAEFGVSPEGASIKTAKKYSDGEYEKFYFYNGAGIKAAFAKLYTKPSNNKFENIGYQKLYDLVGKKYIRDFLKMMVYLRVTKAAEWNKTKSNFLTQIKTNKEFYVHDFSNKAVQKLFPQETDLTKFEGFDVMKTYLMGSILRREVDGSMNSILDCVKIIIKDYDPEAMKIIAGKL